MRINISLVPTNTISGVSNIQLDYFAIFDFVEEPIFSFLMQSCTKCPAGYKCPDSSADDGGATPCSSGTYSSGGQDSCTECPAGFKCPMPFAAYVVPCVPGTYSEANAPVINVCGFWTNCVASFSANIDPLFRNRCVQIVLLGRNARKTTPQAPPALLAGSA